jgi:hypothetical protein
MASPLIATATNAMIAPASHDEERRAYANFARQHGEAQYRAPLAELYSKWDRFNNGFFAGRLLEPHLAFGRTAPRSLGHCEQTTGYGGQLQITLNDGLMDTLITGQLRRPMEVQSWIVRNGPWRRRPGRT